MKVLLYLPLAVLILLSVFTMLGLGSELQGFVMGGDPSTTVYYDYNGHSVCYANGTAIGEPGVIHAGANYAYWLNGTSLWGGLVEEYYTLWWDVTHTQELKSVDIGNSYPSVSSVEFDLGSSIGFFALIVGLMALAVVVGLRVLGSGTSEISVGVVVLGTAYSILWAVFSALVYPLIVVLPFFFWIFYFVLTVLYTLGVIQGFSGGGND